MSKEMEGVYTHTALVPFYAFVAPVYDFRSLDDLQVVDEVELCEMYAVYTYSVKSRAFKPFAYYDTDIEARDMACHKHAEIAQKVARKTGMRLAEETQERIRQAISGATEEAFKLAWENEE